MDKWSGDHASISATPAGGDDYVYELNGTTAALGTLTASTIKTVVSQIEVTTNSQDGYTVAVYEDSQLLSAGDDIDDVADGTVTIGSEEYGISTTGDNATGSGDFAITTSNTNGASSDTFVTVSRTGVT